MSTIDVKGIKSALTSIIPAKNKWPKWLILKLNMSKYKQKMGYSFNINNPSTFTEKIQWYKLFYKHKDLRRIVDKYEFKQYIDEKIGPGMTIPLVKKEAWGSINEVKKAWNELPKEFVLKSTISSNGRNILFIHNKDNASREKTLAEVKTWFNPKNTMLNQLCTGYYECKPRVIAEEYMESVKGQLFDYKVFCFSGKPYFIYAASEHFEGEDHLNGYPISFYDFEWNKLDVQYGTHKNGNINKPIHLDEMIKYAQILSQGFPFVRIDFFDTEKKLYLAEMTFYPGGGHTQYKPDSINKEMGMLFKLST